MKIIDLQDKVVGNGVKIFTVREFGELMGVSEIAAQKLVQRYALNGILVRLKKGTYMVKSNPPSAFFIANRIYKPSYISFETALSHHGIIPETVHVVTSATTKPTREFVVEEKSFLYHKIKRKAYTGYEPKEIGAELVQMACPEKALIDYLYYVHLGKKKINDRTATEKLNREKMLHYAKLYDRKNFCLEVKNDFV